MPKLVVKSPSDANQLLKLETSLKVPGNQIVVGMEDDSRFAIFRFVINALMLPEFSAFRVEVITQPGIENWKVLFTWRADSGIDFPGTIVDDRDPLACYKLRITYTPINADGNFPGLGIEYASPANMFTDPETTDTITVTYQRLVKKPDINSINNHEVWFPLKESPLKIYRVYYPFSPALLIGPVGPDQLPYLDLEFHDFRSRYIENDPIPAGKYSYDPVMETVIINAATFLPDTYWEEDATREVSIFCDYVTGSGCKALVPVEAVDVGPMFDVDIGTVVRIHPDDYVKLPQENDTAPIEWQVINDKEFQGGYQYWNAEYLDLVAYNFDKERTTGEPGFNIGYRGSGVNFQKVGSAPDSFDKDVADYRQFWLGPDGQFVKGLWQTKTRGYVTFIGPPNKMVPKGIRTYAPSSVKYSTGAVTDEATGDTADALAPRIPNGGMLPAPLILKLNVSTATQFPPTGAFYRKTAAFKPRILLYLRERVKYNGATHWKDVGDGFGASTEITGVPYWL